MSKQLRIAIGSIMTECNHLGGQPTDIERFKLYQLQYGSEILDAPTGSVGGMVQAVREGAEIVPLIVASTCPGGPLTSDCYLELKDGLLRYLRAAGPVDGVLLSLHGSATVEDVGDLEGDLLQAVREFVGENVPIAATLDPHAHVTGQMVQQADLLVGWETYPHVDAHESGIRAARLLFDTIAGKIKPAMALAKVPVLVSGVNGETDGDGPFADVMRFAKSLERCDGVLCTSVFLVHPYLDLPGLGGGGLVITDNDIEQAKALANEIAMRFWSHRFALDTEVFTPEQAIEQGLQIEGGPVLLVETADCCGGGAAGDSVATLKALLKSVPSVTSFAPVVDPEAAAQCHQVGVGREVELQLGHKLDPKWGEPLNVKATVFRLGSGKFEYSGGFWAGTTADMGPSAVVQIAGVQVLIMSNATYDWSDEPLTIMGMDSRSAKFIVVKNPMNYRVGYAGIARATFLLDTPGPTPATLRNVQHQNVERPYYPRDREIPDLKPTVVLGRH